MAYIQMEIFVDSLRRPTNVQMVLPNDATPAMIENNKHYQRTTKTLFALHGYSGGSTAWLHGSGIEELAQKYNLAIVCPTGENSFYLDGKGVGRAYGRLVGEELVEYLRKTFHLAEKREDTFICGLSMGGFGALHTGLRYPDTFGGIIALSSALIVHEIKNQKEGFSNVVADYDYYVSVFGDLSELEESENNPEVLVKKMTNAQKQSLNIFMACGTEDFLLAENRRFHDFLVKEGVSVEYWESAGQHDWKFWNQYLEPGIHWMLRGELEEEL